ncbi:hypothetical protein E4U61_002232 [Claviceps capensis]|nr:hypothetical protein E4U61_002232 [Claviceps capensis]
MATWIYLTTSLDIVWMHLRRAVGDGSWGGGQVKEEYVKVGTRVGPSIGPGADYIRFSNVLRKYRNAGYNQAPNRVNVATGSDPTTPSFMSSAIGCLSLRERALHQRLASIHRQSHLLSVEKRAQLSSGMAQV